MKKIAITLILLMAIFLTSCTSSNKTPQDNNNNKNPTPSAIITPSEENPKVSDYFPFKKDVYKRYKGNGNEYLDRETYVDFIHEDKMQIRSINPGTTAIIVYEIKDGALKRLYSRGEAYYRYDYTSFKGDEEILIKEPIKVGTSWTLKDGSVRSITGIDKEIETPSGKYKALEITTDEKDGSEVDYYVKDIGHVKYVYKPKDGSFTLFSELEEMQENKPLVQNIRFYFPDASAEKQVYIDRNVEMLTNEDMKYKFQKELKTVPEGSKLAKVLPKDTQVSTPILDEEKGTVTINFSSHLINDANAGVGFESMLLHCIANTFGDYYNVDKVVITVDDKLYESGHFMLKPGEYLSVDTKNISQYK